MDGQADFALTARLLGIDAAELRSIAAGIGDHYHKVRIPREGRTPRILSVPCPRLKSIQRKALRILTAQILPHAAAMGGVPRRSIVGHAWPHRGTGYLLTTDIENFFDSVHHLRVQASLCRRLDSKPLARELSILSTFRRCLPQGAPTSMYLGNVVLFGLDRRLHKLARRYGGRYTRYVDDIAISVPLPQPRLRGAVLAAIERFRFRANLAKTREVSGDEVREICGLIVGDSLEVSDERRQEVLAECALLECCSSKEQLVVLAERLRGHEAYLRRVDPQLAKRVRATLLEFAAGARPNRLTATRRVTRPCPACAEK